MCGIVGYVGRRPAVEILIKGLRRLEYRGYDSAGIAFFDGAKIEVQKSEGKLENVEKIIQGAVGARAHASHCGIGHTRWATHGKPTTTNAHPHRADHIVLVHNGIIENYQKIKKDLISRGHAPKSETDSELFGFLVLEEMERGLGLVEAVRKSFTLLEGACSIVVMSEREPGKIVGVRNGSPMVAAVDPQGGVALASDAQPLVEISNEVYFLEHGDVLVGSEKGIEFFDLNSGKPIKRDVTRLEWSVEKMEKQGFPHFMLKEIHEQPTAMIDTLNAFSELNKTEVEMLRNAKEITLVACGTSWHAALLGQYWFEQWAKIPAKVELASEFRYRDPVLVPGSVVLAISQSGETADTLAVLREVRQKGIPTVAITNVRNSSISREVDATFYTSAGPEIGVAATKTLIAQMACLVWIAANLAKGEKSAEMLAQVIRIPHLLETTLDESSRQAVLKVARSVQTSKGFFFIGRGYSYPLALEGALKLKEIAYVHAEGYAAGELKHGPIAMIDEGMTVVVISPRDAWREKTISNLQEVKARGAKIVGIGNPKDTEFRALCDFWLNGENGLSTLDPALLPFLYLPAIQLLSYELAVLKGTDVDKPRNLAKSVTVE